MPKVSVITPTYNREEYIKKCVDSVLNQTLDDIELIVIDDGSTDNTEKILKKYDDERLRYIKRDNHGIGSSRNYGIDISKGDYIIFVDSDDYLDSSALDKLYNEAINNKADIVVCDYIDFYKDGTYKKRYIKHFEKTKLKGNPELLLEINLGPCNKLFSRNLFSSKEYRFPENIKYEDMPLVVKLLKQANAISKLDENLCYFLMDNVSETTVRDERVFDIFKALDMTISNFSEKEYENSIKELVISKLANYTIQQRYQNNKKIRNKFIDEAFLYMKKIDSDYKHNIYFKKRNKIKAIIEKNKLLTKIYCSIYSMIKQ